MGKRHSVCAVDMGNCFHGEWGEVGLSLGGWYSHLRKWNVTYM